MPALILSAPAVLNEINSSRLVFLFRIADMPPYSAMNCAVLPSFIQGFV